MKLALVSKTFTPTFKVPSVTVAATLNFAVCAQMVSIFCTPLVATGTAASFAKIDTPSMSSRVSSFDWSVAAMYAPNT